MINIQISKDGKCPKCKSYIGGYLNGDLSVKECCTYKTFYRI